MTEEAIEYFKVYRKIFCEDHLKICPKDSIAYQATLKEKEFYDMAIKALEQLSVTPTRPTGKWISRWYGDKHFHVCSECSEEFSYDAETGIDITNYNFCPNCGAKMVEPQESEE